MDRQEAGEKLYRRKFIRFGLAEQFEFIRRDWTSNHGKKMVVRCRSCDTEFAVWDEVFKGRQKHMLCKSCGAASDGNDMWTRSSVREKAIAYYEQGHSLRETADFFDISEVKLQNAILKAKASNGGAGIRQRIAEEKKQAEARLIQHLSLCGFDYLGGYEGRTCSIVLRCRTCGKEFERTAGYSKKHEIACPACKRQADQRRHEKEAEENLQRQARAAEAKRITDEIYSFWYPSGETKRRETLLSHCGVCEVCGKAYIVREYVKSCGLKCARDSGVCSLKCRDEKLKRAARVSHKGRQDSHRHRAVKYGCEYDSSVSLARLIKRDGLRCALCGEMCDLNDHSWSKYSGPRYPSIDHIIPMSKGGGHTWDNVQVAHIACNSEKGAKTKEVGA